MLSIKDEKLKEQCLNLIDNNKLTKDDVQIIADNYQKYPFKYTEERFPNYAGEKRRRLKMLYKTYDNNNTSNSLYICRCDCGNMAVTSWRAVTSGRTYSCGCYKNEINHKRRRENKYDLTSKDYGIGWAYNTNKEFYFDKEDYDMIKDYSWCENNNGYIVSKASKEILLHRLVMGVKNRNGHVDHIKHNKFDNRKSQLRITTCHNNTMNRSISRNNTSGVTGVNNENGRWRAYIYYNDKVVHLGTYKNKDDAIKARRDAENYYFGEFGYNNSMEMVLET